jgi:hypothetical protein
MAISADVLIATASAPNASALAKSEEILNPPVIVRLISDFLSFYSFFSPFSLVNELMILGVYDGVI